MRRSLSVLVSASLAFTGMTAGFAPSAAAIPAMPEASQSGGIILVRSGGGERKKKKIKKQSRGNHAKSRHRSSRQHATSHSERRHVSRDRDRLVVPNNSYYSRHYHRDYDRDYDGGAALAAGIIGFAAGTIAGSTAYARPPVYYGSYGSASWIVACRAKYASFNPRTGMYLGYDGYWHRCVLP